MFDKTNRREPSGFHLDLYTRATLTTSAISLGSPISVYPIDGSATKPPTIKPIYLGRFDFSAMRRMP